MRVLFVTHAYPRWDGDVAGVFVERLALALTTRGQTVDVVVPADRGTSGEEDRHGVHVRRVRYASARAETLAYTGTMLRALRSPTGLLAFASLVRALTQAVRSAPRPDVVHAHWWVPGGLAALRADGGPFVVTLHGTDVAILERFPPGRLVARRVLRQADRVTAVSSFLADRARRWGGIEKDVLVQPMPVEIHGTPSSGGGGIVVVGRLSAQKRVRLVLDAVSRLRRHGRTYALTIAGDGPERAALERRARDLGIADTTRFLGSVEPHTLSNVFARADVMAFAARGEGFGLAAAEALLLGVPVVALEDGGGVLDVVPRRDGGRVVPADASALANALREVGENALERAAARSHGASLRARLGASAVAEQFERCYREITGAPRR